MAAMRAGTAIGSGASTAYRLGRETSGETGMAGVRAGMAGVASAAADYARDRSGLGAAAAAGSKAAWDAGSTRSTAPGASGGEGASSHAEPPAWARRLRSEQSGRHRRHMVVQAVREGDRPSAPTAPDIKERDS
jgi:type IV secretion system protein TrbL